MTDQSSEDNESSEVDRAVHALLGEARVDEPMPVDVADRLEAALADAASGEPGRDGARASVVRMRRRTAGWLVAAAVLIVGGGVGIAQLHAPDSSAGNESTSAAAADSGGSVTAEGSSPSALSRQPAGIPNGAAPQASPVPGRAFLPALTSAHFAAGVRQLIGDTPFTTKSKRTPTDSLNLAQAVADCTPPPGAGEGADVREISLDRSLATLLIDPPTAQPRRATAYSCDGAHMLASTELSH